MSTPFADALRKAREARGIRKSQLARAMGITGPAISQWESGATTPELFRFAQLVEILGLDTQDEAFARYLFSTAGSNRNEIITAISSPRQHGISPTPETIEILSTNIGQVDRESRAKVIKTYSNVVPTEPSKTPPFRAIQGLARDIPVYGIAVGGEDGDFQFNGSEADRVTRPPGLANARDIFALYVVNDSMYPAWREGALFYVNPNRPPVIGDDVVVEMKPQVEGEAGAAFLKRLKARRGNTIIVEQFNPPKEIEFDRDAVRLYRVIPWEEALGLS